MKELKLGPDGVLPIMEFDLENKPVCMICIHNHRDTYMLHKRNDLLYRFRRISIKDGVLMYSGIFDYGDNKNIFKSIEHCIRTIVNERQTHDYEMVIFDSMQELHKYYHNQIKE